VPIINRETSFQINVNNQISLQIHLFPDTNSFNE